MATIITWLQTYVSTDKTRLLLLTIYSGLSFIRHLFIQKPNLSDRRLGNEKCCILLYRYFFIRHLIYPTCFEGTDDVG